MKAIVGALGVSQIIGYGTLYYAFPIVMPVAAGEFGLSQPVCYAVFSAGLLAGGFGAPFAGRMMDRLGAPLLMVWGSLAAGFVLILMALAPVAWVYLAGIVLTEVIAVTILYDAAFATLARLTGRQARRAITQLTLVAGFASTIFWPLTGWLVAELGWRATYGIFAGLHLTVALGLHLWLLRRPVRNDAPALRPEGPVLDLPPLPAALRTGAFRAIAVSFALSGTLITALTVHLVPILSATGFADHAAFAGMLMGPAQVAIRAVDAAMWRRLHPLTVALVAAAALPFGALMLLSGAPVIVAGAAFAILLGTGAGLSSIVRGSVPLALLGPLGYGEVLGRLALARTLATGGAPFLFSASVVALGMTPTLIFLVGIGFCAVAPIWRLRSRLARAGLLAPLR
ncbi:MAG: MFS transporter [Paracoccaceae bacterium]